MIVTLSAMTKVLLYLALAYLIWQFVKRFLRGGGSSLSRPDHEKRAEPQRVERRRPASPIGRGAIDYSKVRDADYRDIR